MVRVGDGLISEILAASFMVFPLWMKFLTWKMLLEKLKNYERRNMISILQEELKNCLLEIKNTSITMKLQVNVMNKEDYIKNMNMIIVKVKRAIEIMEGK